jgi:hypothetical protein
LLARQPEAPVVRAQQLTEARLQVYSGEFQITTTDIESSADRLSAAVTELGGYLQTRSNASLSVRIPAKHFQTLVDRLDEFGTVASQSIQTDDVTDQYQDLGLRLEVLAASRQRLMALIDRAAGIDELLKLEQLLTKLTTEIERLKGKMKGLDSRISYSTIQVRFTKKSFTRRNQTSPFAWINQLGPAQVLSGFHVQSETHKRSTIKRWLSGKAPVKVPDGFLLVKSSRDELQAISPDDARVWHRAFPVSKDADLEFWAKAIRTHLVEHQGCRLIDESNIRSEKTVRRQDAYQMLVAADSDRGPLLHLLTVSVRNRTLRPGQSTVQITEFTAPPELYEEYRSAVALASTWPIAVQGPSEEPEPMLLSTHP